MIGKQDDIVGSLFQEIAHSIRHQIDAKMQPYGLTRLKWRAVGLISEQPGLTQTGLAQALKLKPAATGKLVDRLQKRGLVVRRPDKRDRRVHQLYLTDKSARLLEVLKPVGDEIREEILQDFSPEERMQLEETLKKLKRRLAQTSVVMIVLFVQMNALPLSAYLAST